jgi:DNA mismatch repair protein MSH5
VRTPSKLEAEGSELHLFRSIDVNANRHILQELTVGTYIANDTYLTGGIGQDDLEEDQCEPHLDTQGHSQAETVSIPSLDPSLLIMTGPNYSGKSVYLKQVALIVYMAHIGW